MANMGAEVVGERRVCELITGQSKALTCSWKSAVLPHKALPPLAAAKTRHSEVTAPRQMLPGFWVGKPSPGPSAQCTVCTRPETQDRLPPGSAKHLASSIFLLTYYPWSQQGCAVSRLSVGGRDSLSLVGKQMTPLQPGRQGNRLNQSQSPVGAALVLCWVQHSMAEHSLCCTPHRAAWGAQLRTAQQKLGQGPKHVRRGRREAVMVAGRPDSLRDTCALWWRGKRT